MATWDEMSGITWGEARNVTWGQARTLPVEDIEAFVALALLALASLSSAELTEVEAAAQDGSLATGEDDKPVPGPRSVVRGVWEKVRPRDRRDVVAYLSLFVAVVGLVRAAEADGHARPVEVHVVVTAPASSTPAVTPSAAQVRLVPRLPEDR